MENNITSVETRISLCYIIAISIGCSLLYSCSQVNFNFTKQVDYDYQYISGRNGSCYTTYYIDAPIHSVESDGSFNYLVAVKIKDAIGRTWTGSEWVDGANGYIIEQRGDSIIAYRRHKDIKQYRYLINGQFESYVYLLRDTSEIKVSRIENILLDQTDQVCQVGKQYIFCPENISEEMIQNVGTALKDEAYLPSNEFYKFDKELKEALYDYQEDNNLSVGFIDYKTLYSLGIHQNEESTFTTSYSRKEKVNILNSIIDYITASSHSIYIASLIYEELESQANYLTGLSDKAPSSYTTKNYKGKDIFLEPSATVSSAKKILKNIHPKLETFSDERIPEIKKMLLEFSELENYLNDTRYPIQESLSIAMPNGDYSSVLKNIDQIKKKLILHSRNQKKLYQLIQTTKVPYKSDNNISTIYNAMNQILHDIDQNDISKLFEHIAKAEEGFNSLSITSLKYPNSEYQLKKIGKKIENIKDLINSEINKSMNNEEKFNLVSLKQKLRFKIHQNLETGLIHDLNQFLLKEYKNALKLPEFHSY